MAHRYLWGPNVPVPLRRPDPLVPQINRTPALPLVDRLLTTPALSAEALWPERYRAESSSTQAPNAPDTELFQTLLESDIPSPYDIYGLSEFSSTRRGVTPLLSDPPPVPILDDMAAPRAPWRGNPVAATSESGGDGESSWFFDIFDPGHATNSANWLFDQLGAGDALSMSPNHDYQVGPTLVGRGFYPDSGDPDHRTEYTALRQGTVPGLPPYVPVVSGEIYPVTFPWVGGEVGHVQTIVSPDGSMTLNRTRPDHYFRDGTVLNQMTIGEDGNVYVTSRGKGTNTSAWRAWMNDLFGRLAFEEQQQLIADLLSDFQKHQR